ncbi:hypothetical protein [Pseudomonas amygdali]|uniref:hypothetical protein n=1 Tax=Pseudomonas amygdali TaxID=47877 RepID=UPI000AA40013|nr:hypothetical protein [Pseudomonas amygdali]
MTTAKDVRIDFSLSTKLEIFKKVNGRCSVPRCTNPTVGPFLEYEGALNMGVACHIYSAAEDGPRGRGEQTDAFIGSEKNGLWCCSPHAALIDKKKGGEFPATVLFAWKALAEARIRKLLDDEPSPLGWVDTIEFSEYENLINPPSITLSRNTLVFGPNCSGKSSVMEVAASICHSKYAETFNSSYNEGVSCNYRAKVKYSTVDTLDKALDLEISAGKLLRKEGSTTYLLPPGDLEVIICSEREIRRKSHEDDIDFLLRYLGIDKTALFHLAEMGGGELLPGDIKFEQTIDTKYDEDEDEDVSRKRYKIDGGPYMELFFRKLGGKYWVSLERLSTSEYGLLLLSFAITKARETCKQKLTLFLVDGLIYNFDSYNFEKLLVLLSRSDFQSALILPPRQEDNILDKTEGNVQLKKINYLESWQLRTLKRSEFFHFQG